jgi:hypothetical protein
LIIDRRRLRRCRSFTLSGLVDKAIYVIRWETTPRNVALAGIRQMLDAGADSPADPVWVDVKDARRLRRPGYYQGSYRKYYATRSAAVAAAPVAAIARQPERRPASTTAVRWGLIGSGAAVGAIAGAWRPRGR